MSRALEFLPSLRHCVISTIVMCGWLRRERSKVRRAPSTRFLLLPLRNAACVHRLPARSISVASSSLLASRRVTPVSRTSAQHQRANVEAKSDVQDANTPQSQSPSETSQPSRPWTVVPATDGSVLDELASWRSLKEPLERYLEFVRCNHFGNAAEQPRTDARPLEDDSAIGTSTDKSGLPVPVMGRTQQESDCRLLLQRPREEPRHITSHHCHQSS